MYSLSKYSLSKYFILASLCLLLSSSSLAQSTTVSGQVTDSGAQAWNNGTYTFQFIPNNNFPSSTYSWTGGVLNQTISGSLNATGGYSQSIPSNTSITPSGSQWRLQVCSGTNPVNCFTVTQTITGGSQTVNATPPAIVVPPGAGNTAYVTAEVSPAIVGSQIYIIGTGLQLCSTVSGGVCTVWTGGSSSSSSLSPAPIMGYYLSNACAPGSIGTNGLCFNTPANTQQSNTCAYTSGSPIAICDTYVIKVSASVASNVATYAYATASPASWAIGNSITVLNFGGGDAFFNQTCTLTAVTVNSASCALTHANASSTTALGVIHNTSAGPFVVGDVGKKGFGYNTCWASQNLSANSNNAPFSTTGPAPTILSFQNSRQVTMTANAVSTATIDFTVPYSPRSCFIWGSPDDTGAAAMDTAMLAANFCPKFHLAAANYMFLTTHFTNLPAACAALGVNSGYNFGNIVYASGFELEGRGSGSTVIYLPPAFPETGSCTNGQSGLGCFVIPLQGRWSHLQITGGGNRIGYGMVNAGVLNQAPQLISMNAPASMDNVVLTNFGGRSSDATRSTVCIAAYGWSQLYQINTSGCGTAAVATNTSSSVTIIKGWFENIGDYEGLALGELTDYYAQAPLEFSRYHLICYDCTIDDESTVGAFSPAFIGNTGLRVKWYRGGFSTTFGHAAGTANNLIGYLCKTTAGCLFDVEDASMDLSNPSTGTGQIAILCNVACTNIVKNSTVKGTSGGFAVQDVAGSQLYDMGANTWGAFNLVGTINADGHSLKGICTGVGTAASTLGLYSTGPNVTATTCTSTNIGTGTAVSGTRILQNLIVSATAAGTNASSGVVTVLVDGAASTITCTIGTSTTCSDSTHTVSLTDGQRVSIQFTTQAADTLAGVKAFVDWN